jgi:hypothetical protein
MLGNSGGSPLSNRTSVGIRGLTTVTPAKTGRTGKKKGVDGDGRIDLVVRDEERNRMSAAIAEEEEGEEAQDEIAQPAGHSAATVHIDGEAFRTDAKGRTIPPGYGDVDQGNLGDAWLLASCAAVAQAQPVQLMKRVTRESEISFNVRLDEEDITVTPDFPTEGYADPMPNGQTDTLWVALVEKAFAMREAGSFAMLETGSAGRALEALTGKSSRRVTITELSDIDRLFAVMREGKRGSSAMVLRTRESVSSATLSADHHYAVIDVIERGGERYAKLYNPWGTKKNKRTLESMVCEIKLSAVREYCEALYMST